MSAQDPFDSIYALLREGRCGEALSKLVVEGKREIAGPYQEDLNHAWYVAGDAYFRSGDFASAVMAFQRSIENCSDDVEAIWGLGNAYSEVGEYGLAEEVLRRAIDLDPSRAALRYNLGNALFDQGKFEAAIEIYEGITGDDSEIVELARRNIVTARQRLRQGDA